MTLTKETIQDKIEVVGDFKHIQVRTATVIKEDGVEMLTPSHKVLQNRLTNVKKGDNIRIVYKGTEDAKKKGYNPTEMYKVYLTE